MSINRPVSIGLVGLSIVVPRNIAATPPPSPPSNVLIILTDDQGRGDFSAFDTRDIRMPNMDRLFREGMTFQNFFANSCVCSPSRAALLTGCYPDRVGVPGVIREETPDDSWGYLLRGAKLLPEQLKQVGCHTAMIGKWHLGIGSPNTPNERGFDLFEGFLGDMMDDYWTHRRHGLNLMRHDREVIDPEGHATDILTGWACAYLEERAKAGGPFLLYLAYNAPHDPKRPLRSGSSNFMNTALYVRVSTLDQRTDSQEMELKRYCRQRGWKDFVFYVDRISGAKASRPQLDQLMQDIRAGKIERLVVYKLDRLGRSLTHLALILDELNRLKVPLIASSQGIDTSDDNPAGRLQLGVLIAVAEFERGIIKERVNAGLAAAKARGVQLGCPATITGRTAEINKLKAQGLSLRAIARELKMPPSSVHKALQLAV